MTDQSSESGYGFAVPTLLLWSLGINLPDRFVGKRVPATSDGFDVIVDVYSFTDMVGRATAIETLMRRAYEQGRELVFGSCELGVESCMMLVASKPSVELLNVDETPTLDGSIYAESMVESDMRQMGALSRFMGLRFVYCHSTTLGNPSLPEEPRTVYLFYTGRPPGICNSPMTVDWLFEMQVWTDGQPRLVNGPTRGRGRLIHDGETPIFQVLGSTYYQLCLTHTDLHGGTEREVIFRKLLGCMYRDLVECRDRKPEPVAEATAEDLAFFGAVRSAATMAELQRMLQRAEAQVLETFGVLAGDLHDQRVLEVLVMALKMNFADVQEDVSELADEQRKQQLLTLRIKVMRDSEFVRGLRERLPRELGEIKSMEGVAAVRVVDGGVHIATTDIVLEYNGRRYNLGPFTIRLDPNGTVEAWSETPRHPRGHHHPHVSRTNLACYGNVTLAIAKYMSEFRFADAALIVMRWLNTYNPETTLHPLEEWPAETDERR